MTLELGIQAHSSKWSFRAKHGICFPSAVIPDLIGDPGFLTSSHPFLLPFLWKESKARQRPFPTKRTAAKAVSSASVEHASRACFPTTTTADIIPPIPHATSRPKLEGRSNRR